MSKEKQEQVRTIIDQQVEVMLAHRDGAKVMCKHSGAPISSFTPNLFPEWNWQAYDYEVMPAEPRTYWLVAIPNSSTPLIALSEGDADDLAVDDGGEVFKVREVV